jgi:hypothetical protein
LSGVVQRCGQGLQEELQTKKGTISVGVLAVSILLFDNRENRDIDIVLAWIMMILAFPISIVCAAGYGVLFSVVDSAFATQVGSTRTVMVGTWLGLFACGYLQWFYLVPLMLQKYWPSRGRKQ